MIWGWIGFSLACILCLSLMIVSIMFCFVQLDPEVGEPGFRRLVLRSVATVTRLYVSIVPTECEVLNLTGSSQQQKLYAHFLLFVVTGVWNKMIEFVSFTWQVFVSMLIKSTALDLYPWHQIMVLEVLRVLKLMSLHFLILLLPICLHCAT